MTFQLPDSCCSPSPCPSLTESGPRGPQGLSGAGADGTDGVNAYSTTALSFVVPAVNSNVQITVDVTSWIIVGQPVYIQTAKFYQVVSVDSDILVTVMNLGYAENASVGATINGSRKVSPSGSRGPAGPVTSVGMTLPAEFTVTNSPVTSSGVLTGTWATETPNAVFAGPSSGTTAGTPSFRTLTATDIPDLSATQITSGTLPIAQGGTGQSTASTAFQALQPLTTKGDILGFSTSAVRIPIGTNGQALVVDSAQTPGLKWATTQPVLAYGSVSATYTTGTDGGSFTSGSWQTRPINTVDSSSGFSTFSLATNVLSLDAGTYLVRMSAVGNSVGAHIARVYRSDGTSFYGTNALAPAGTQTISEFDGVITITSGQTLRVDHQCQTSKLLNGLGSNAGFTDCSEVYLKITLLKVA